jgi:hypothetical protein
MKILTSQNFSPSRTRGIVWIKENNRQIALAPGTEVREDERFNPYSNTIEKKSSPPTGACPTIGAISGRGDFTVSFYDEEKFAAAAASAMVDRDAQLEAERAMSNFKCPNPGCQRKRLGPVTIANITSYGTRATLSAVTASAFYGGWKYEGHSSYDWNSSVICE